LKSQCLCKPDFQIMALHGHNLALLKGSDAFEAGLLIRSCVTNRGTDPV
jgi:hypothetical protein